MWVCFFILKYHLPLENISFSFLTDCEKAQWSPFEMRFSEKKVFSIKWSSLYINFNYDRWSNSNQIKSNLEMTKLCTKLFHQIKGIQDFTWNQFHGSAKPAVFAILGAVNLVHLVNCSLWKVQKFIKIKIQSL